MKSILIVVLSLTLAIVAFMTRPTEEDFLAFLGDDVPADRRSIAEKILQVRAPADVILRDLTFNDRWLWVQVEDSSGKVLFTGVFDHWFSRDGGPPQRQGPHSSRQEENNRRDQIVRRASAN